LTQIGFPTGTEFALFTFGSVKRDNMIAHSDVSDTFTHGFDNATAFVAEDGRENAFRIYSKREIIAQK
jgi:hypothetical protein